MAERIVQWKKAASLTSLMLQTTCLVLTTRYSRTEHVDGTRYLTSTVVFLAESFKLLICAVMVMHSRASGQSWMKDARDGLKETVRLALPSALYTAQNNLQYVAISNIDAATFQVTYQLRILATAVVSVCLLKRHLDTFKWASILLLTAGVSLAQHPVTCHGNSCLVTHDVDKSSWLIGICAVLGMCLSSAIAGVYFEMVSKASPQSLWARNGQLALSGVVFSGICTVYEDMQGIKENGFFQGYSILTWIIVLQQAALGLVISVVIKYADNIMKCFASSISIILSATVSYLLLGDLDLSVSFLSGTVLVITSMYLYSMDCSQINVSVKKSEVV